MSSIPTCAKSPWTSRVNSFLFEISLPTLWSGMLLEHSSLCIARFDTMDTKRMGGAKDAQESKPSKVYTWKQRKKKRRQDEDGEGGEARPAGLQPGPGRLPGRPPARACRPPGRPRPAPRPAQAGSQAGLPAEAPGLQPGPGRFPGRPPASACRPPCRCRRPPSRPRPAPRPDSHQPLPAYQPA